MCTIKTVQEYWKIPKRSIFTVNQINKKIFPNYHSAKHFLKYPRQWFSQSPPRCTQQFKAAASGKARIAAQQGELASGRAPGRDINLIFYFMLSLSYVTFFLHFSHFLTKVALSLSNFLSISSNPICKILPLVEHQKKIFSLSWASLSFLGPLLKS